MDDMDAGRRIGHDDLVVVYDDRAATSERLREIINQDRFSGIIKRRQRLGTLVSTAVETVPGTHPVIVDDPASLRKCLRFVEREPKDRLIVRLPSFLAPTNLRAFRGVLQKCRYAMKPMLFGHIHGDDAAGVWRRDDLVALMSASTDADRRTELLRLGEIVDRMEDAAGFVDLRRVGDFLRYMIGATETRHFNASNVENRVFRKASTDIAKMEAEYRYFHVAPEPLKRFLLPTFDFSVQDGTANYAMEHLPIPDAALLLVHGSLDEVSFDGLLDRFFDFVDTRTVERIGSQHVREVAEREIWDKVERRVKDLLDLRLGRKLDASFGCVGPHGSVRDLVARAAPLVRRAIARDRSEALAFSHGDPCFSNILFQRSTGLFRLIDPRGAITAEAALMHPLYDLAKFSHSVLGGYDFINHGLFECRFDDTMTLELNFDGDGPPAWMSRRFRTALAERGYDPWVVRAYELTLFLSLLPLHVDAPRKLPAFVLTAGKIIDELEGEV
jgi:hypothetical protein